MGSNSMFNDVVPCGEGVIGSCDVAPGVHREADAYNVSTTNGDIANTASPDPAFDVVGAAILAIAVIILAMCLKWRPSAWLKP